MMKKLSLPKVRYALTDADGIMRVLRSKWGSKKKINYGMSLYGAYKAMRTVPAYAAIGDFPILSMCVKFLRSINLPPTSTEIRRTMLYFQPPLGIKEKRQLTQTFFNTIPDRGNLNKNGSLTDEMTRNGRK